MLVYSEKSRALGDIVNIIPEYIKYKKFCSWLLRPMCVPAGPTAPACRLFLPPPSISESGPEPSFLHFKRCLAHSCPAAARGSLSPSLPASEPSDFPRSPPREGPGCALRFVAFDFTSQPLCMENRVLVGRASRWRHSRERENPGKPA